MTARHGGPRRPAGRSVTLNDLTAQALTALQAAGLDFESLELDAGFRRKPRHDHLWYVADTGVGRNGQPWLMVTAGDAKVTGDVSTPLVVYKSWETGRATIDPAEASDTDPAEAGNDDDWIAVAKAARDRARDGLA